VAGEGNGDMTARVVCVHCPCENHNCCAACFEPLAETRLSAYRYDEAGGCVYYLAAYAALSHRCEVVTGANQDAHPKSAVMDGSPSVAADGHGSTPWLEPAGPHHGSGWGAAGIQAIGSGMEAPAFVPGGLTCYGVGWFSPRRLALLATSLSQ
jgi:hypothetical protein